MLHVLLGLCGERGCRTAAQAQPVLKLGAHDITLTSEQTRAPKCSLQRSDCGGSSKKVAMQRQQVREP
jgi:hypothetical protein